MKFIRGWCIKPTLTLEISWNIFCLPLFNIHIVCNYLIYILAVQSFDTNFVCHYYIFVFYLFSSVCLHWERRRAGAGADTWDILTYISLSSYIIHYIFCLGLFDIHFVCHFLIYILFAIIMFFCIFFIFFICLFALGETLGWCIKPALTLEISLYAFCLPLYKYFCRNYLTYILFAIS